MSTKAAAIDDDIDDLSEESKEVEPKEVIVPWKTVQKRLQANLKIWKANPKHEEGDPHALNLFVPQGVSLVRSMHNQGAIKSAIYMPYGDLDRFACADAHHAHLWKAGRKISKMSIKSSYSNTSNWSDIAGLNQWIYAPQWKALIVSTARLELKICDG
jgi:hypothetical protein